MSTPSGIGQIKHEASQQQHRASRPRASAFVSANAGAGKTHVLVGRIIRLMLDGVAPERILCLTYTRAAAAEMSTRLFETLSKWIARPDEKLISEIHGTIGHAEFKPEKLDLARRLFTRALETPGGLKVQTIHAFCERLLQRFPVEAGIMPGFSVLDETAGRELLDEARARVLADGDAWLADSVAITVNHASEQTLVDLLAVLVAQRDKLAWFASGNGFANLRARLNNHLGITDADDENSIRADFAQAADWRGLGDVAQQLREFPGKTNDAQAAAIDAARQAPTAEQQFSLAGAFLLTAKGERKAETSLLTAKCIAKYPDTLELMLATQAHYVDANDRIKALSVRDATEALVKVALAVIREYEALKQQASAYDYVDLIGRTNDLLNEAEAAAWVLYKLDRGIDHILIDEAQDTSPDQWRIIDAIADEFFAGEGARDAPRTMFAVGDRKQSIYSFQGADPDIFEASLAQYASRVKAANGDFEDVGLLTSFRSSKAVLEAVDRVFACEDAARGVVPAGGDPVRHTPSRLDADGLVEIWEIERQPKATGADPWQDGEDEAAAASMEPANVRLARRIARTIWGWLDEGNPELLGEGVPVRPEHILILVRERASLMEAIVRALKDEQVPVAGADRLRLLEHITAQDLMALGRFVILPEDDLTLASLLKSPLLARDDGERFNDDDDIFPLAHKRGVSSLWQRLHEAAGQGRPYAKALARLEAWRVAAGRSGVYRFYAGVLSRDGGRAAFLKAIGHEAGEPVDAFLQQCLEYEREGPSTMAGFLAWLEATAASLKRDMEQGAGEVRVMTVHGAKGLEAPIVILPDTCSKPDGKKVGSIVFDAETDEPLPVWRLKKEFEVEYTEQLKNGTLGKLTEEYNRLLYVAMTRARDRLYVCGFKKSRKTDGWETDEPDEGTWYHAIRRALVDEAGAGGAVETVEDGRKVWRFGSGVVGDVEQKEIVTRDAVQDLPAWATTPAPPVARPGRWLAPSKLAEGPQGEDGWSGEVALSPLAPRLDETRFRRGELVHRLLQTLPGLAPEQREPAARRYLSRNGIEEPELSATVTEILKLFADQRFAAVFSGEAQAEVSIAGLVDPPQAGRFGLSGQIDRLLVTDTRVLVVDFKTNRPPPADVSQVPEAYLRQLAAYAHVLARVYLDRTIECALLWTDAPELMVIPQAMLDEAWQAALFTSPQPAADPA